MKHGSLFSGIGGFDLAAQWMGWENAFHCEISEFPRKVLHHYWPNALSYENIKETDFTKWRGKIDVISGGFPCQPYSLAGKRLGKGDDRHLWPEMLRCIREIKPRWVVGENVFGIVNWNGGLVFNEVQADLEAEGYEVQAYVLPACAVNAPHRRDRVWFVAHSNHKEGSAGCGQVQSEDGEVSEWHDNAELSNAGGGLTPDPASDRRQWTGERIETEEGLQPRPGTTGKLEEGFEGFCGKGNATYTDNQRWQEHNITTKSSRTERITGGNNEISADTEQPRRERPDLATAAIRPEPGTWDNWPTIEPTICRRDDGLSSRLDGITFSKWRNESIKAYGNAVVPQVVYQIFKVIEAYEPY